MGPFAYFVLCFLFFASIYTIVVRYFQRVGQKNRILGTGEGINDTTSTTVDDNDVPRIRQRTTGGTNRGAYSRNLNAGLQQSTNPPSTSSIASSRSQTANQREMKRQLALAIREEEDRQRRIQDREKARQLEREQDRMVRLAQDMELAEALQRDSEQEEKAREAKEQAIAEERAKAMAIEEEERKEVEAKEMYEKEKVVRKERYQAKFGDRSEPGSESLRKSSGVGNAIAIRFRLHSGRTFSRRFLLSDLLEDVMIYVEGNTEKEEISLLDGKYGLVSPYPRTEFTTELRSKTLSECGIDHSTQLLIVQL